MLFFATALLGSVLVSSTLAMPAALRDLTLESVPAGSAKLAYDADNDLVYAFSKSGDKFATIDPKKSAKTVEKRAGTCAPLTLDDVQKIPGWTTITDVARDSWGDGGYDLKINLEEYPENPANMCSSNNAAEITISGDPSCTKSSQSTEGQFTNTDGTLTLTNTYTETNSNSLTVTKQASIGTSVTVSATVGFPGIVDITSGFTTSMDITNTQSSESHTDKTLTNTQTISMEAKSGQTCRLDFNTASCVAHGTGSIKYVASGWVWFAYHDKVDDHYFWAINMDAYLPNEDDRASTIDVDAAISVESTSDYNGRCDY